MAPTEKVIGKVLKAINPDELIELTGDLVRINSVWDPVAGTNEQGAADFVARWAAGQGFDVQQETVAPGRPNVIVTWPAGPGERTLMFEGHTDVVTPGDVSLWRYEPFKAHIIKGRMFGRGTNDTKGNLAAMLIAMTALKRSGDPLSAGCCATKRIRCWGSGILSTGVMPIGLPQPSSANPKTALSAPSRRGR
jgi:succinyl-diaminopimelate desuccinylase